MKKIFVLFLISIFLVGCFSSKSKRHKTSEYLFKYSLSKCKGEECLYVSVKKEGREYVNISSFCGKEVLNYNGKHSVTKIKDGKTYFHGSHEYNEVIDYEYIYTPITDEQAHILEIMEKDLEEYNHCLIIPFDEIIGFVQMKRVKNIE